MTVQPFRLGPVHFRSIARGGGDADAMRVLVAARRSRTTQLINLIARQCPSTTEAFQIMCDIQRVAPAAVRRVLDDPSVGAWATRTALKMLRGVPAGSSNLAFVAAAAALRAGVPVRLSLPPARHGWLPSVGTVPQSLGGKSTVADGLVAGHSVVPLPTVVAYGISVHVEQWIGNHIPARLPICDTVDLPRWQHQMSAGWNLLGRNHPGVAETLASTITAITPLASSATGTSSATVTDAFGCVFLSLAPDACSLALTFAHELQHTKLVALMDLFPLVRPGCDASFYAPWRGDPRPLIGLLHGAYAHLGVAGFWRQQRHHETGQRAYEANVQFARWREAARYASEVMLESGWLTTTGRSFVYDMLDVLHQWYDEPVPGKAFDTAARLAAEHQTRWISMHGPHRH